MIRRLVVLDFYFGSICQLFAAMPPEVEVIALSPVSPGRSPREIWRHIRTLHQNEFSSATCRERKFMIPGWSRSYNMSSAIVDWRLRRVLGSPEDTAIVYMFPQYAKVAERHQEYTQIYYAVDPYTYYDWDAQKVLAWEKTLHASCKATMAVSHALCDDFTQAGAKKVVHVPNAVADSFLNDPTSKLFRPADLPHSDRLLVGCTGNINNTYDWELIGDLANKCPDIHFVFLGALYQTDSEATKLIQNVLNLPNVKWIGPCSHQDLPRYLKHFDVCFNPLRMNHQNNRRSPLRLYDYLSSGKYILSTDVAEASEHAPYVHVVRNSDGAVEFLRGINKGDAPPHQADMLSYISQHTWRSRAREFMHHVHELSGTAQPSHALVA